MSSKVTIYEVALAARVSLATVSRVLNNPEKVKEDTKERVLRVIKELGYRPNAIARGLASRRTTTVGVLVSDITRASVAEMLAGIADIAMKYSYSVKLFSAHDDVNVIDLLKEIVAEQVDGVLLLNDELDLAHMKQIKDTLEENEIPLVLANVVYHDKSVPSVSIDYDKAGYEITKLMIEAGRKDIYLISTVRKYSVNEQKELGYQRAMQESNLEPRIFRTSGTTSVNRQHFASYFSDKKVDGAIGVRDSIAVSFMNIMSESGKKIPQDILVSGFQNTKYGILSRPTLTSIDVPVYDIGAVAMRLLTKLMNKEAVDQIKVILPHYIVRRDSM